MTYYDSDPGNVRIVDASRFSDRHAVLYETPSGKTRADTIRDGILDDAERMLREARDLVVEALDLFGLVAEPQHRTVPVLLGQQIEQVIEHRRLHP